MAMAPTRPMSRNNSISHRSRPLEHSGFDVSGNSLQVVQPATWRRMFDRFASGVILIVSAPMFVLIGVCIFLETGWPIFFVQTRMGWNGTTFGLIKFRTMRQNMKGPSLTVGGDQRITAVGGYLRKFKLDELPQLWNVLRGEMAFVGPRPEVPEFVDLRAPIWQSVLSVRPGITNPASIAFRDEELLLERSCDPILYYKDTLLPAKLAMNLEYIKKSSFWGDLRVIARTAICAALPGKYHRLNRIVTQETLK